jgi:hypothetical protein
MDWKGQLAVAIGIFAVITVMVLYVIPITSNRLLLRSNVRVGEVHVEHSDGIILLLHYAVWGKVLNNGTLPSGPVTVTLNITSPKGALLFKTDAPVFPDTLSPGQGVLSHSNSLPTIYEAILVMIGRTMYMSVNNERHRLIIILFYYNFTTKLKYCHNCS